MANRLKYAGVDRERIHPLPAELPDRARLPSSTSLPVGGTGYMLPTYTAMLELRAALADRGAVERFWEQ